MKKFVLVALTTGLMCFTITANPGKTKEPAPAVSDEAVTLMSMDKDGNLTVNDDNGKLLGTISVDGVLKTAPHVKQNTVLANLLNSLHSVHEDQRELNECLGVLHSLFDMAPDTTPDPAQETPDAPKQVIPPDPNSRRA